MLNYRNWILSLGFLGITLIGLNSFAPNEEAATQISETHPSIIHHKVPFVAQAPLGDWEDYRQATGCEEASVIMALAWAKNTGLTKEEALKEIIAISDYELRNYGYYEDTSAKDTFNRIFKDYFKYDNASLAYDINVDDIKKELADNHLVLVPVNGAILNNPHYKVPYHMILVVGYDNKTEEFITNDPGTKHGESFRYSYETMSLALQDYSSGKGAKDQRPDSEKQTAMIVVAKEDAEQ